MWRDDQLIVMNFNYEEVSSEDLEAIINEELGVC